MFFYRGLFLAVTISLASIVFADVIVQPDSKKLYDNDPHYSQHWPQYYIQPLAEQYHADQLPNQEWNYLSGIQTLQTLHHPDESYQGSARSHLDRYPYRLPHQHSYLPRPHHVHYAKIGGHGYVRPSVFVGNPQPPMAGIYLRRKRSDLTSTEFDKSETVAHGNDVAAKSPLTEAKHPTAIDSLLPEREPTYTNKCVENHQIKNNLTK